MDSPVTVSDPISSVPQASAPRAARKQTVVRAMDETTSRRAALALAAAAVIGFSAVETAEAVTAAKSSSSESMNTHPPPPPHAHSFPFSHPFPFSLVRSRLSVWLHHGYVFLHVLVMTILFFVAACVSPAPPLPYLRGHQEDGHLRQEEGQDPRVRAREGHCRLQGQGPRPCRVNSHSLLY